MKLVLFSMLFSAASCIRSDFESDAHEIVRLLEETIRTIETVTSTPCLTTAYASEGAIIEKQKCLMMMVKLTQTDHRPCRDCNVRRQRHLAINGIRPACRPFNRMGC